MSTKKHLIAILGMLAAILCGGCKSDSEPSSDATSQKDTRGVVSRDIVSTDGPNIKGIEIWTHNGHLSTDQSPDTVIRLSFFSTQLEKKQVESELQSAFELLALPGKTKVAGTLKLSDRAVPTDGKFTPSSPLATDTEYLILIKKGTYVFPYREQTLFRVGSLPRVVLIKFNAYDKYASLLNDVCIRFSEYLDGNKAAAAVKVEAASTGTALSGTLLSSPGQNNSVYLKLTGNLPLSTKVRITVGVDVGSKNGVKLDGKYTFQAGSGPLVVELVPADNLHLNDKPWEPTVTF